MDFDATSGNKAEKCAQISASARGKIALIQRGLTPAQLAQQLGVSRAYIYALLNGHVVTAKGRAMIESVLGPIWSEESAQQKAA